mmetsp:Transcript_42487/g.117233  ORF Transcript_42487/g.117233 Transcript_42487/m.117233 type:complete len:263 (+) Transcript_42487:826-1614(+)
MIQSAARIRRQRRRSAARRRRRNLTRLISRSRSMPRIPRRTRKQATRIRRSMRWRLCKRWRPTKPRTALRRLSSRRPPLSNETSRSRPPLKRTSSRPRRHRQTLQTLRCQTLQRQTLPSALHPPGTRQWWAWRPPQGRRPRLSSRTTPPLSKRHRPPSKKTAWRRPRRRYARTSPWVPVLPRGRPPRRSSRTTRSRRRRHSSRTLHQWLLRPPSSRQMLGSTGMLLLKSRLVALEAPAKCFPSFADPRLWICHVGSKASKAR